jgi:phosphoglucosamine mutase
MSNLALEHAFARLKIPFARARVGDRYVLELLRQRGWQLGGENSGHIICLDKHTTGDGIISALQVLRAMRERGLGLRKAAAAVRLYPQALVNVPVRDGRDATRHANVKRAVARAERVLGEAGRVLIRASGTEPVIRVMVEGREQAAVRRHANAIAAAVRDAAGG